MTPAFSEELEHNSTPPWPSGRAKTLPEGYVLGTGNLASAIEAALAVGRYNRNDLARSRCLRVMEMAFVVSAKKVYGCEYGNAYRSAGF
jgi:hypothetical protein